MKTAMIALVACLAFSAGCSNTRNTQPQRSDGVPKPLALPASLATGQAAYRFAIQGMTCEGCAGGLRAELRAAPGVVSAEVSLHDRQALVVADTNRTDVARLLKVIAEAGFEGRTIAP
jgi:copper chaperone CopZ